MPLDTSYCVASLRRCGNKACARYIPDGVLLDKGGIVGLSFVDMWKECLVKTDADPRTQKPELRL